MIAGNLLCPKELIDVKMKKSFGFDTSFLKIKEIMDSADCSLAGTYNNGNAPIAYYISAKRNGIDLLAYSKEDYRKLYSILKNDEINKAKDSKSISYENYCMPFTNSIYYKVEINGISVGFLTLDYTEGFDSKNLDIITDVIRNLRTDGIEFILAYVYWNSNLGNEITGEQKAISRIIAEAGVDYIVGNNNKFLQKYEVLECSWGRKVPVLYSIGNFINCSYYFRYVTSVVLNITLYMDKYNNITIEDNYLPCFVFTTLGKEKYVVDFLNKKYNIPKTDELVKRRKEHISDSLGEDIKISNEHGFNIMNHETFESEMIISVPSISNGFETDIVLSPSYIQSNLIKEYMLSDEFRDKYGKALITNCCSEQIVTAINAIKEYKGDKNFEFDKYEKLIIDMLYSKNILGFKFYEYFGYGFEKKSIKKRTEFISESYRLNYFRRLNKNKSEVDHLDNKYTSYQRLKGFYRRDIIFISDDYHKDRFKEFCMKHNKFIVKPDKGSFGQGIKVVNLSDYENYEELFLQLRKEKPFFICEELIIQKKYLAEFHANSVNTMRVFTYNNKNNVIPICSWLKTGCNGSIVDNGGAGGLIAAVNIKSGVVIGDAANEKGERFKKHPNSRKVFKGVQIEEWDELIKLVCDAAVKYPEVGFIGWDVAHSINGWEIIEGNVQGQINLYQLSTRKGIRKNVEKKLSWHSSMLIQ